MANSIEKRLAALEAELATTRSPKLIFCWTKSLADRIAKVLPSNYTTVSIRSVTGCANDDELEAMIRQDPAINERLDRLLAGIPE
jgi:hypothetical protein